MYHVYFCWSCAILYKIRTLDVHTRAQVRSLFLWFITYFNRSLSTGIFPCSWKLGQVEPVFKSDDNTIVSNYQLSSLLSVPAKLFQYIVYSTINNHLKKYSSTHRHGFVKARSMCTNFICRECS